MKPADCVSSRPVRCSNVGLDTASVLVPGAPKGEDAGIGKGLARTPLVHSQSTQVPWYPVTYRHLCSDTVHLRWYTEHLECALVD